MINSTPDPEFKKMIERLIKYNQTASSKIIIIGTRVFRMINERISIQNEVCLDQPNRNDPCFCGSGLKFKKCCLKGMY
jgi:uncharacterized protein YchJ